MPGGGTVRGPLDTFTAATLASGASVTYTVTVTPGSFPIPLVLVTGQTISGIADPNYTNNIVISRTRIT